MKKITKTMLLILIGNISFFIAIGVSNAATATTTYPYKLSWNIQSIYYYIDGSAVNYSGTLAAASDNWVNTGVGYNKLYPGTRTYNKNGSAIDFYAYSSIIDDGLAAFAETFVNNANGTESYQSPDRGNWNFAKITINNTNFEGWGFPTREGVITHELGHVYGLRDNPTNQYSIMCHLGDGRKVNTVQKTDNDAFNSKY